MLKYPRGSEWRRWDLHVHSPLSILNNQFPKLENGQPDWDSYVSALEAKPIAVYGITDYFTIDGYKVLRDKQVKENRLKGVRLLPNIEFRLDKFLTPRDGDNTSKRLNFHVLFSDEVSWQDIEDHFLHDLNFAYEQNPTDTAKQKRLKPANLEALGKQLKAEDGSFAGSALEVGAMTAVVKLEDILQVLTASDRFRDRYLLLLPAEHWDQITWGGQDHLTRKLLLQAAHMVMASNPKTISWCLGREPYTAGSDNFIKEFGTLKPCVHGSDAHSIPFIGHPCAKRGDNTHDCGENAAVGCELRNFWVKADPTFEGLRQLLYEPFDRVKIQASDPTNPKSIFSLRRMTIHQVELNDELTMSDVDISLNRDLVAVIGGKGSGKTAFVDLLADAFMDRENSDDRNSFVRRIADSPNKLEFTIEFANGSTFSKTLGDEQFVDSSSIVYIAQGELERYIDENSDLNQYIHRLIFNSTPVKDTVDAFDYDSLDSRAKSLQADLDAKNGSIIQLEKATAKTVLDEIEKVSKQVKAESEDVFQRIAALEAQLSKETIDENTKRQEEVGKTKAARDSLIRARDLANDALRQIDTELAAVSVIVEELNTLIGALGLGNQLPAPEYPDRQRLVDLRTTIESKLRDTVIAIEKEEQKIKQLAEELKEHNKLLARRKELSAKDVALGQQSKLFEEKRRTLVAECGNRTKLLRELLATTVAQRTQYAKVISVFTQAKEPILTDLDFQARVSFNAESFLSHMEGLLDNRQVEVMGTAKLPSVFTPLTALLTQLVAGDDVITNIVAEIDRLAGDLKSKLKKVITPDQLYKALYRSYLSVHPVVQYKQTSLDRLSLGQKATVLIKIYLAEGETPIIIDSHDDHLDNEYIMDELVGAIRHAKSHRQVIVASNNGNVVVNSDAEQLVVAQRKDGVISYDCGSLEDPGIRNKALRVLEGGSDAFKKRQEKYRMA